jgi:hypothetical protein
MIGGCPVAVAFSLLAIVHAGIGIGIGRIDGCQNQLFSNIVSVQYIVL